MHLRLKGIHLDQADWKEIRLQIYGRDTPKQGDIYQPQVLEKVKPKKWIMHLV